MRAAMRAEEKAGRSPAKHFRANRAFHLALVEGTGNPQLVQFMEHVWIGRIGATLYETRLDPSGLKADHKAHRSIAEAIESGDGERAERLTPRPSRAGDGAVVRRPRLSPAQSCGVEPSRICRVFSSE